MSIRRTAGLIVRKLGALALAAYFPGFFRIHLRYIRNYPIVWAGLFVAPFLTRESLKPLSDTNTP